MSRAAHLSGQKYFAAIGDSKSATPAECWQYPFINFMEGRTRNNWSVGFNHAVAGWTVANAVSGLSTALAANSLTVDYAFIDLGSNDSQSLPAQATFESNYASILDQLHTKWPSAIIKVAQVYRSTQIANCATINGWIDNVLVTRVWSTVAFSESDWLPSWTLDGTHPDTRIGGYAEMARRWFAAL